jgi:hypothetical protein
MSRIYFHSPSGDAEVLGAERAHAGCLVKDLAAGLFRHPYDDDGALIHLTRFSGVNPRAESSTPFLESFRLAFTVGRENLLNWRGHEIAVSSLALNTALLLGNDTVKFLARLQGQCEIHGYVEGPNRAWLADIIERGVADGILRGGMGWDGPPDHPHGKGGGVIPLLRSRDDEPVVTSYSVCDSFPYAAHVAMPPYPPEWSPEGWSGEGWDALSDDERASYREEGRDEAFDSLTEPEQWAFAMDWLRSRSETMLLELKPDDWDTFRFGHELTVLDLEAPDWQTRVERALGLEPATP